MLSFFFCVYLAEKDDFIKEKYYTMGSDIGIF